MGKNLESLARANVSNVKTRKFDVSKHNHHYPWFETKENYQPFIDSNPWRDTAYHLSKSLVDKSPELIAAYKIYAFVRNYGLYDFLVEELNFAMRKHDNTLHSWWNGNAKYVLPDISNPVIINYQNQVQSKDKWKEITIEAAGYWKQLAEEWEIIIIPDFIDRILKNMKTIKYYRKQYEEKRIPGISETKKSLRILSILFIFPLIPF
ncbi:MAG: hypothetical protein IPH28_20185 [Cytophagaceae bacterium]|nr:hypothetical protein [Cytophagaceae bacterium]